MGVRANMLFLPELLIERWRGGNERGVEGDVCLERERAGWNDEGLE